MKKKIAILLLFTMAIGLCACGKKNKDGTEAAAVETITVETDYGTVKLGQYKDLSADEITYTFTDEDVENYMESTAESYTSSETVDRPSESGDILNVYMTASVDGEVLVDYSEESYEIWLDYEEFGSGFDAELTGVSAGDHLNFTEDLPEDFANYEDMAGKTVSFDVTVIDVTTSQTPELTDEFVTETLGYGSMDEFRSEMEEQLNYDYNSDSVSAAKEDLINQAMENAEVVEFDEDFLSDCIAQVEASYEEYEVDLGCETLEEVYESLGITEDDVTAEAEDNAKRILVVAAIAKTEKIEISDEEVEEYLAAYAEEYTEYYGEDYTADDLLEMADEEAWKSQFLDDEVLTFLYENGQINPVSEALDLDGDDETMDSGYYDEDGNWISEDEESLEDIDDTEIQEQSLDEN